MTRHTLADFAATIHLDDVPTFVEVLADDGGYYARIWRRGAYRGGERGPFATAALALLAGVADALEALVAEEDGDGAR